MFILHCFDDNSDCQVEDDKVIFDKNHPPKSGDNVKFYWKESSTFSNGKVIIYSDDPKLISKKWKDVTASNKINNKSTDKSNEDVIKTQKRTPNPKRKWPSNEEETTPEKPAKKREKKSMSKEKNTGCESGDKESQDFIKNKISKKKSQLREQSDDDVLQNVTNIVGKASFNETSPTKEEYKKLLAESERQLLELKSKVTDTDKANKSSDSNPVTLTTLKSEAMLGKNSLFDSSVESQTSSEDSMTETSPVRPKNTSMKTETTEDKKDKRGSNDESHELNTSNKTDLPKPNTESDQLLGQFHAETMINIGGNIFCTKKKYDQARSSGDAMTMARHMIDGIFKREAILRCTLTGQPARAQGPEKRMEKVEAMDYGAKEQIIECVLKEAKSKGWKKRDKKNAETREYLRSDIERAMTQRVGEIKREFSKNIILQKKLNRTN